MSESSLKRAVLAALRAIGVPAWSNALGGRKYRTGLGAGSADVIGVVLMRGAGICPTWGRFLALELKSPKVRTDAARAKLQATWRALVNTNGGYAAECRSVAEAVEHARRAQRGESPTQDLLRGCCTEGAKRS